MGADSAPRLVCERCGSRRLRASRAHGFGELWARRTRGLRFHVCRDCGARGTHQRRRGIHGRHGSSRRRKARRARIAKRVAIALVAIILGAWIGYYATTYDGDHPPAASDRQ